VLAPQGKVDGWGRVHRTADDAVEIDVDAGAGAAWEARLRRFLLRTKAEITVRESVPTIEVRGAAVEGGVAPLGPNVVGADFVGWDAPGPPPGTPDGAVVIDGEAAEVLRIRAGVPRWGADLGADTIPATVGQWAIDASVSFTKGCYTGQELVARIDSRGGNVPVHLRGMAIEGPPAAVGDAVEVDGETVATITSVAADGAAGGSVALGFVPRRIEVGDDGVAATVAGRSACIVVLPFPPR
jgi:tRNA-modifying protein YgfZ